MEDVSLFFWVMLGTGSEALHLGKRGQKQRTYCLVECCEEVNFLLQVVNFGLKVHLSHISSIHILEEQWTS